MNTLCFDFGNTRLKAAFFQHSKLIEIFIFENGSVESIGSILKNLDIQNTILSSVIDHDPEIENLLATKTKFHKLSPPAINFSSTRHRSLRQHQG